VENTFNVPNDNYRGNVRRFDKILKPHGKGTLTLAVGGKYVGEFADGQKCGHGVREYAVGEEVDLTKQEYLTVEEGGTKYEGEWKADKWEGKGTFLFVKEGVWMKCEGEYVNGMAHGHCSRSFSSGAVFDGQWKEGQKEGKGVQTWPDGDRFEGEWVAGKKKGKGTYTYANGKKYEGEYENDVRQGFGVFKYDDGVVYSGQWAKDLAEGEGVLKDAKGVVLFEGRWVNGIWCIVCDV
jgi:hypothetical protein